MSTWVKEYQSKLVFPEKAVSVVKSGDWIGSSYAANVLPVLDKALAARTPELFDIKLIGGVSARIYDWFKADPNGEHFTWNCSHFSAADRYMAQTGSVFYMPLKYSEILRYIRENLTVDILMIQVSPMDKHGNFNLGPTISHYRASMDVAKIIIVEVNEDMPIGHGGYGHYIHISEVDYI